MPESEASRLARLARREAARAAKSAAWEAARAYERQGTRVMRAELARLRAMGRHRYAAAARVRDAVDAALPAFACRVCGQEERPAVLVPTTAVRAAGEGLCATCLTWADALARGGQWEERDGRAYERGADLGPAPLRVAKLADLALPATEGVGQEDPDDGEPGG